jgi:ATP-binding cassette subfamily B multidrug efflux pump
MNIHEEKEMRDVKDSQLMKRLFAYAKPFWKMILLCIVMVFLIVVADLARPYLIKISIDDYINGAQKPMLAVSQEQAELLEPLGKSLHIGDMAYVRVSSNEIELSGMEAAKKTQIVQVEDQRYMIGGWLPEEQKKPEIAQIGESLFIATEEQQFEARKLSKDEFNEFRASDFNGFIWLGILFLITVIVASILNYVQTNLLQYTGQNIIFNIRKEMFHHLSRMSMSFFNRNPVGRLVVRLTSDTEAVNQLYSQVIVNLVKDVVILLGIVIIMLSMSVKLTLLTFAVIPILAVITFWYKIVVRKAQRRARVLLSSLNSFLAENLSGIRITQLFVREQRQFEEFEHHNKEYYKAGMRGSNINSIFQPAIGFLGHLAIALLIWYGGLRVIDGAITFGIVYAFTQYITLFFKPLMSLAEKYNQIQTAMVGAERIFDMLDEKPEIEDRLNPHTMPSQVKGEIIFENVWFAYNQEDWVLRDISFTIKPGQSIAFVGATGAGKSSIIQLINRFYDIQKGSIKLDGIDIRDIPLKELRKCISIVQQDVFLFTGDIASNIKLNNDEITNEQVLEASRMVNMDTFVKNQPMQYQTPLGERGVNLSLGQRQLLSFARAIAFRPQILILDEATSNIDTETELIVQDALSKISKGRTTMIVAHRLSTIQHADQIIVMHKGKVREMGNHSQLLEEKGYYHRLYELQYKDKDKDKVQVKQAL